MKILLIALLFISFNSASQSQVELNDNARKEYERADKKLNQVYSQILNEYATNTLFINNLKEAERIWITFRDAELLMKYPENSEVREGTVFPVCHYLYLTKLTNERIKTLQLWLNGEPEGEVCGGSVKVK